MVDPTYSIISEFPYFTHDQLVDFLSDLDSSNRAIKDRRKYDSDFLVGCYKICEAIHKYWKIRDTSLVAGLWISLSDIKNYSVIYRIPEDFKNRAIAFLIEELKRKINLDYIVNDINPVHYDEFYKFCELHKLHEISDWIVQARLTNGTG